MKAAQFNSYGDSSVTTLTDQAAKPTIKDNQVLVEVKAASLNRIDSAIRSGYMEKMLPLQLPATLGGDFAGIVQEVGASVTTLKVGDEVYGNAGAFKGGSGSLTEFVAANADNTSAKPQTLDFKQAAALPLVASSAVQGLMEHSKLQSGQKILIQGGAGGIGSLAIQIAKSLGAYVVTTVSASEVDFVRALGADEVINYESQDFSTLLHDLDAVFDTVGGDTTNKSLSVIKSGGTLVTMSGQPDEELAKKQGVTVVRQMTAVSPAQLTQVAELVDAGKLKVQIEKTFPFDQTKEAFAYFETAKPKGKIVVEI